MSRQHFRYIRYIRFPYHERKRAYLFEKRLVRLGTCFSLVSLAKKLLSITLLCPLEWEYEQEVRLVMHRLLCKRKIMNTLCMSIFVNLRLLVLKLVYIRKIFDINHCNYDNYSLSLQWI